MLLFHFLHKEQYKSSFYHTPFSFILRNIFFRILLSQIHVIVCTRTEKFQERNINFANKIPTEK